MVLGADQLVHRRPPGYCDGPARLEPEPLLVVKGFENEDLGFFRFRDRRCSP